MICELDLHNRASHGRCPACTAVAHRCPLLRAASTARDVQLEAKAKGTPWMISKSYDCFAPVSKFIPKTEVPDCHNLDLWMTVNGKMIQKGNTKMMIHTVG